MTDIQLQAKGIGYKNTPNIKTSDGAIHARPSSAVQKSGTPHLTHTNPQIVQINKASLGGQDNGLQIVGKKVDDAKSTKEILKKSQTNIFSTTNQSPNKEESNQDPHQKVSEKLLFSGGFKFLEQNIDKKQQQLMNQQEQAISPNKSKYKNVNDDEDEDNEEANKDQLSKKLIMQKLGVKREDVNVYFDIMDDRVYDVPNQQEDIKDLLISKTEQRLQTILQKQEEINQKKALIEKEKAKKQLEREEAQSRLLSKKPQSYFRKIKEQQQAQLDEAELANMQQIPQQEEEEEEEWKKQYKKQMQAAQNKVSQDGGGTSQGLTDQELTTDDQQPNMENQNSLKDKVEFSTKLDNFIQINPDLETTETVRQAHEERLRELEYLYFKRKRDGDKVENKKQELQQKIQKGIIIKPQSPEEREYKNFEDEFKNYVRERRKVKQVQNIQQKMEKKDFDRYQATSPDPNRWQAPPKAVFQELKSTLIPKGDVLQTSSASNLMKNSQLGKTNALNLSSDKLRTSQLAGGLGARSLSASKLSAENNKNNNNAHQMSQEELKIMQALFNKIDKEGTGQIEKFDLARALLKHTDLKEFYCINEKTINQDLASFQTSNKKKGATVMDLEEMALFLKQNKEKYMKKQSKKNQNYQDGNEDGDESNQFAREIRSQRKQQTGQNQDKANMGACLLTKEQLQIIKSVFEEVDKHKDLVVARAQLIEKLRNDVRVIKMLHLPAVYIQAIGKQLNVEKRLYRIEKEQLIGNENEKKSKEYITWNQFYEYFTDSKNMQEGGKKSSQQASTNLQERDEKIKMMKIYSQLADNLDDQNEIDLGQDAIEVLLQEYEKLPKQGNVYVNTSEFIEGVRLNSKFNYMQRYLARRQANKFDLLDEVFSDVLTRMEQEAEEYLDKDEIMEYFTRRGRPKFAQKAGKDQQNLYASIANPSKIQAGEDKFVQDQKNQKKQQQLYADQTNYNDDEQVEAYDSDPETHTYGRGYTQRRAKRNKSVNNMSISKTELSKSRMEDSSVERDKQQREQQQLDDEEADEDQNNLQQSQYEASAGKRVRYKDEINEEDEYKLLRRSQTPNNQARSHSPKRRKERSENQQAFSDNEDTKQFDKNKNLDDQVYNYKKLGSHQSQQKSKEKKFKLTKPEPYEFDEREKQMNLSGNLSIRKQKLKEMVETKEKQEEENMKFKFRAREVPAHVKQPLFEKKLKEQEERRAQVKANSVALTIQREKPFSFYTRDKNAKAKKKSHLEREDFIFKAKEVPWFCSLNMMEKIKNEEELKRQERVAKHAHYLMTISKLPPRMEMHEQLKRAQDVNAGLFGGYGVGTTSGSAMQGYGGGQQQQQFGNSNYNQNNYSQQQQQQTQQGRIFMQTDQYQPIKANQIPDFKTLQKNFQDNLDKKRQNKRPTKPVPFNFQASRKAPPRDYLDMENQMMKQMKEKPKEDKVIEARKLQVLKPVMMPPSTKKFEDYVEKLRKDKEEKMKQQEEVQKQIQLQERKKKEMKKRVMSSKLMQQDKNQRQMQEEQKKKKFQEEWKKMSEDYKTWKQKLKQKTKDEPLLIERPPMREKEIEKMKSLNKVLKIMEKNKIKDIKSLFTPEEYDLVKDLQYLKQNGYAKYFDDDEDDKE